MPLNHSTAQTCAHTTPNTTCSVVEALLPFLQLLTLTPSELALLEPVVTALSASDLDKLEKLMAQLPESCQSLLKDYLQQAQQQAKEVQA